MPDPVWSAQYSTNQSPEQNGFTRRLYNSPTVNEVTGGNPANRRLELVTTNGDAVFELTSVPALNLSNGATAEVIASSSGPGHAGFELTFNQTNFGVHIYPNSIAVVVSDGLGEHVVATAANTSDVTVRATVSSDSTLRVYRAGVLIETRVMPPDPHNLPSALFWGEGGGTQIFKAMRFYIGGPVAPG